VTPLCNQTKLSLRTAVTTSRVSCIKVIHSLAKNIIKIKGSVFLWNSGSFFGGQELNIFTAIYWRDLPLPYRRVSHSVPSVCEHGKEMECSVYGGRVNIKVLLYAVCVPKFIVVPDNVGDPLQFQRCSHIVYIMLFSKKYYPLNLSFSVKAVEKH